MILDTEKSIQEFFREGIEKAQKKRQLSLHEVTQFYVVNLLSEFLDARKLFDSNGKVTDEPLATIFGRALESPDRNLQYRLFKQIGDRSLYVSGFFADSFKRKIIDVDYYIAMGETAYGFVSQIAKENVRQGEVFSEIFDELAIKFVALVDLISEISESAGMTSDQDLLRLYERWLATKSKRLSELLREKGINPIQTGKDLLH